MAARKNKIETPAPTPTPKKCHIFGGAPVPCLGECKGATTHWQWETCNYGKKMQKGEE